MGGGRCAKEVRADFRHQMRRHFDAVGCGYAGCVQPTGYATYPGYIGHHVIARLHANGAEQAFRTVEVLADLEWHPQFARYCGDRLIILMSDRLFEPIDSFLLQLSSAKTRLRACQGLIVIHHDLNMVAGNAPADSVQSGHVLEKRRISQPKLNGPETVLQ